MLFDRQREEAMASFLCKKMKAFAEIPFKGDPVQFFQHIMTVLSFSNLVSLH